MGPIPENSNSKLTSYAPLKSFEDLITYREKANEDATDSLAERVGDTLSLDILKTSQVPCTSKTVPLNTNFSNVKITFDGKRMKGSNCPKTLVCHDFKGGYGDDRFVEGTTNFENYTFQHWLQTDIFVYFSHYFVTIPPLGWINAAHSHGVKVLGTIITECDEGVKVCDKMLKDSETVDKVVEKLSLVAHDYGFEGYLVNIENELKEKDVPLMLEFLEKLTTSMKKISPFSVVIWYDSVTVEGKLKWQDCLNDLNKKFLDACDGIYLNYGWNDEKLQQTLTAAGNRNFDVFVGVDVFGRGCFGGGGLNTCLAVEKAIFHNLSLAIFAPGWTFECHPYDSYPRVDDELWMPCSKYFTYKCLKGEYSQVERTEVLSPSPDSMNKKFRVYFSTDFSRGYGTKTFFFGKKPAEESWFNLSQQSYQPSINVTCPKQNSGCDRKLYYDTSTGFSGGGSLRLNNSKKRTDYESPLKSSPIWFPLDIPITDSRLSIAVLAAWKSVSVEDELQIFLEVAQPGMKLKKVLLGSVDHLAASVIGKFYIHLKLSHFLQEDHVGGIKLCKDTDVEFFFRKNNYDEKEVNGWRISCFLFDIDQQHSKYCGVNALRIGAEGSISLGFISLAQVTHYNDEN